jgi:hypothetical protein
MAATLEIHFLTLKYTDCQFCQNYPKKVAKIKLILAKLAFATDYEAWVILKVKGLGGSDRLVLHHVLGMSPTCGLYAAKIFINLNVIRSRGVGW